MRTFTFLFDPTPVQSMRKSFKDTLKTKIPHIEKDIIRFNNFNAISGILSANKMELFNLILFHKPNSYYELAKIAKKDTSQVIREAKVLANLGVIDLIFEKDGEKEKTRPVANYDEIRIQFHTENKEAV